MYITLYILGFGSSCYLPSCVLLHRSSSGLQRNQSYGQSKQLHTLWSCLLSHALKLHTLRSQAQKSIVTHSYNCNVDICLDLVYNSIKHVVVSQFLVLLYLFTASEFLSTLLQALCSKTKFGRLLQQQTRELRSPCRKFLTVYCNNNNFH